MSADATNAPKNTRAPGRACDPDAFHVIAIHVPPGSEHRRTPIAVVEGELGPLRLTFTVSSLAGNKLVVRPPTAGDGTPGLTLPADLAAAVATIVIAAVKANPEAAAVLGRKVRR